MDIDRIRTMRIEPIVQDYGKRETILYALGLGYGADPLDSAELPFVYEGDLRIVPSYVNLLCHPGFWAQRPEFGIDWVKILHAEQELRMHAPLPPTGALRGEYRVRAVEDKGEGRGALLHHYGGPWVAWAVIRANTFGGISLAAKNVSGMAGGGQKPRCADVHIHGAGSNATGTTSDVVGEQNAFGCPAEGNASTAGYAFRECSHCVQRL